MTTPTPSLESTIRICRICLDSDYPVDLISPCLCTGGSAFVHRKCLDKWRATNKSERVFHYCDVCQFQYVIEPVVADVLADRRRLLIFRLLVTRDILLIVLLIQVFLVGLTFLMQYCDRTALRIKKSVSRFDGSVWCLLSKQFSHIFCFIRRDRSDNGLLWNA